MRPPGRKHDRADQMNSAPMLNTISRLCVLVLIGSGVALPAVVGAMQGGYSAEAQYLSELGAIGAPHEALINFGSFLPVGLAIIVLVVGLYRSMPRTLLVRLGVLFLLTVAIGYLDAFFFHCDPGCPAEGSNRQAMHNLGGLIEYVGAITGLFLIFFGIRKSTSQAFSIFTLFAALLVLTAFIMMATPAMEAWKGGWQRLAEYALVVWFIGAVFWYPKITVKSHGSEGPPP